jgi:hypothetical protein
MITLEQSIIEAVRSLPPDKQKELLEHANRLREDTTLESRSKDQRSLGGFEHHADRRRD